MSKRIRPRNGTYAALDIGTGKVCCFIARIDGSSEDGLPRLIGIGHQVSRGMRNGAISDLEEAKISILNAVHAAEQMAGEHIRAVTVNLSCGQPMSHVLDVDVAISGHQVRDNDLRLVMDKSAQSGWKNFSTSPVGDGQAGFETLDTNGHLNGDRSQRHLVHSLPLSYTIDNMTGIRDPRGMYGDRLGVQMHIITSLRGGLKTLKTAVEQCHLEIERFIVSPYAAGLSCLVEDELDLGATVIDMGAGTTSVGVFYDGNFVYTDVVPIGGEHVTNDIARGLSTPLVHAERLKTLHGSAIGGTSDDHDIIDVPQVGEDVQDLANQVPKSVLNGILRPRLEETFEHVRACLKDSGVDQLAGRRVVLTGGASQLQGVGDLAALMLDKQVRMGRPLRLRALADSVAGPAFATCAGLIAAAAEEPVYQAVPPQVDKGIRTGIPGRFGQWLREHL